jgi:hypothetical protein
VLKACCTSNDFHNFQLEAELVIRYRYVYFKLLILNYYAGRFAFDAACLVFIFNPEDGVCSSETPIKFYYISRSHIQGDEALQQENIVLNSLCFFCPCGETRFCSQFQELKDYRCHKLPQLNKLLALFLRVAYQ